MPFQMSNKTNKDKQIFLDYCRLLFGLHWWQCILKTRKALLCHLARSQLFSSLLVFIAKSILSTTGSASKIKCHVMFMVI